ncbi:hypothetical protein SO802_025564 [Lithocarpus litseifolius]|uniref:PB1-like domain-containing protein n=1 Tax=Lithocarpus litseifolius TaxID=425828 RepID=A0AAW2BXE6_9ROSI
MPKLFSVPKAKYPLFLMDELFSISVHHASHFTENPRKYVGGTVDVVDNCDPERWSKVELEGICGDFGYTSVGRLWYKMPVKQDLIGDNDGDDSEHDSDDHDGSDDMYANVQTFSNEDESTEVDVPIKGSSGGGSGLDDEVELNHGVRDFVEDSSDSWDGKDHNDDDIVKSGQIGVGVMNPDYESEELHSLVESSFDDELEYDSDDIYEDDRSTHLRNGRGQKNEEVKKFHVIKLVAKAEHIVFEKDMLFTTPKQFKEAITKYAVHGG